MVRIEVQEEQKKGRERREVDANLTWR